MTSWGRRNVVDFWTVGCNFLLFFYFICIWPWVNRGFNPTSLCATKKSGTGPDCAGPRVMSLPSPTRVWSAPLSNCSDWPAAAYYFLRCLPFLFFWTLKGVVGWACAAMGHCHGATQPGSNTDVLTSRWCRAFMPERHCCHGLASPRLSSTVETEILRPKWWDESLLAQVRNTIKTYLRQRPDTQYRPWHRKFPVSQRTSLAFPRGARATSTADTGGGRTRSGGVE
jgi:hypothetical protein